MKRTILLICVLVLIFVGAYLAYQALLPSSPPERWELTDEGEFFYDFAAEDQAGNAVRFSDFIDRPTVAFFWTSWCGACKLGMEILEFLYEQLDDEVQILAVNLSTLGNRELIHGREFMEESDLPFFSIYDINGEAVHLYGLNAVPVMLFIGTDGRVHHRHLGVMGIDSMLDMIDQLR